MRVKLLIALAIASIFLLAGVLPAGAVEGTTIPSSTYSNVGSPGIVAPVVPSMVVPCISFPAAQAPGTTPIIANTINLAGPGLQVAFVLAGPQIPSFAPPNFVLQQLSPPSITPFFASNPIFDP